MIEVFKTQKRLAQNLLNTDKAQHFLSEETTTELREVIKTSNKMIKRFT